MRPFAFVMVFGLWAGCGGSPPSTGSRGAIAGWTAHETDDTTPPSRTIDGDDGQPLQRSRTIGGAARREVVRRGPVVDVDFSGADLDDAMRLLAEAAGVDVVVEDGLTGTVDIALHDVRPLDAMAAIAQAHGAGLSQSGRMVIVRRAP